MTGGLLLLIWFAWLWFNPAPAPYRYTLVKDLPIVTVSDQAEYAADVADGELSSLSDDQERERAKAADAPASDVDSRDKPQS